MSLGISTTILLVLTVAVLFLYFSGGVREAAIEVRPELSQVQQRAGSFYLPVTIENTGNRTAEDVIVEVTFTNSSGRQESSEMTIGFLAGNATEDATAVFSEDPRNGDVSVDVKSYLNP